jgi:hypothetical protein
VQRLADMVHQWHMQVEIKAPTLNVTGEILKKKAIYFRDKVLHDFVECLKPSEVVALEIFVASNG